MPSALIFIANGTEEMEFTITYDTLVRGGVACTSVLVGEGSANNAAVCSRGVRILPDTTLQALSTAEINAFDALVVPGGAKGAETLSGNKTVQGLVKEFIENKKLVGMICAGSLAALTSGLSKQPITSHPSVKDQLSSAFEYSENPVVVSGPLVTSRGPGTAFPFALKLVEILSGQEKRQEITGPMIFPQGAI